MNLSTGRIGRALPQGAALQEYGFLETAANQDATDETIKTVTLSELFTVQTVRW